MDYASSILGFLPGGRRTTGISQLLDKLEAYLSPAQVERVREAYEFGAERHQGQKRVSGEPYITHPVAVADILADLRLDADTLVAAILHDVIEDTPTAKAEIASIFGQVVAELVDGVSKLDQIQFKNRQEAQAESFRKMLLAMVRDIRVIMVKLADRMHNMRTLGVMPPIKRRRIARETLEIYAPIAERLGLYAVKLELEDLGFRALYPYRYKVLERELKRARGNQKQFIGKIAETFKGALKKAGITGGVEGREKHLYSIYKKMQNKGISLNEMVDVYGFRIIVDSADTCYRVLGPGARRLQADAGPLQGLHRHPARQRLSVPAHDAVRAERRAHRGADPLRSTCTASPSRASPRTGNTNPAATPSAASSTIARANGSRAWCKFKRAAAPRNFSRASRSTCFRTRCTCSRRRARSCACRPARRRSTSPMRFIPTSATAASPPRSIGAWCLCARRCATARRSRSSPPRARRPNPSWSSFLVTAKARAAIRQYLKNLKRGEALELGRRLLGLALEEFSLSLKKIPAADIDAVVKELNLQGCGRAVREDRTGRASRAAGRAAPAAGARGQ